MGKFKRQFALLLTIVMMLSLIGCGTKTDSPSNPSTASQVTEVTPNAEPNKEESTAEETSKTDEITNPEYEEDSTVESTMATAYPVTVKDSNGDELLIEKEPSKIISIAPNITEMLYAIGAGDRLIGRSDYCDYPEEALNVESIGSIMTPDLEKIISLEPDIVIVSTHFLDETEKQLSDLGIKVIVLYEEHSVTGVYTMIETLGTILNLQKNATVLVEDMKSSIEETVDAVKGLEAPSVYYVIGYGEFGDYTAGGDTFAGELITMAGGNNIGKEVSGWSYSLERLLEVDPDIIVLPDYYKEGFMTADNYKELSAVKNGNVYVIDINLIDRQGYRNAEGLRMLAEIFHKDAFENK